VSYLKYYGFGWFERFGWKYLKWFYGRTDRNFVPSRATIAELASKGFSNLELWERGVDTRQFSPIFASTTLRRSWSPEGAPIALYIGRLVREKDIDILLKACMMLKERGVEFKPVFVGEGPMYDEIAKTLPDAILAGFLRGDDLSRAYASADFFVFPSTTESFGNVVLEAAASGLPCVVAGEGGVTNLVVDGETGLIAQPREAADLALKMELLMGNEMLRNELSAKALEYASVKSWSQVNRRLFEGYSELIEVGGEPASKGQEATFAWRH
jgi:glycosyltransferase involved in cell wall biosynthesis